MRVSKQDASRQFAALYASRVSAALYLQVGTLGRDAWWMGSDSSACHGESSITAPGTVKGVGVDDRQRSCVRSAHDACIKARRQLHLQVGTRVRDAWWVGSDSSVCLGRFGMTAPGSGNVVGVDDSSVAVSGQHTMRVSRQDASCLLAALHLQVSCTALSVGSEFQELGLPGGWGWWRQRVQWCGH